ncbi:MAG: MFS transporter [Caldilineaceae bacterium]|nr:MFS transporter [Caldilineaceae bacterium]
MAKQPVGAASAIAATQSSWLPMAIILLAQIQMGFNVNALPVSIGPIVYDLDAAATDVGGALVIYSLFVAAFVMLGAKLGKIFGERLVFQVTALLHGVAMGSMALSQDVGMMNSAQALAGLAAAALVPTLVVLVAANYQGKQQEAALGLLAGAPAVSGVLAFLIAGFLGTVLSWRYSFGMLFVVSLAVLALSFRLKPVKRQPGIKIDTVGAVLAAIGIILISVGFNNLNSWGLVTARQGAPIALFGLSPAPFMIIFGIVVAQAFFTWSAYRQKIGQAPLLALEVLDSSKERAATYTMLIIGALGPAVNFLIPLYIQIVQGRTSMQTAVATVPYTVSIFVAAVFIVRLYRLLTPRQIGSSGFLIVAVGLTVLAFAIRNDWGMPMVILGLSMLGLGEGALLTLLFNVLVSASPKQLAGDVGALRGTANNLSTAVGTAVAGAMSVALLSLFVTASLSTNALLPPSFQQQVNLDNINFVSNDDLLEALSETTATSDQAEAAVQINTEARLRALKVSFLVLASIALLAVFPSLGLPNYTPARIPDEPAQAPAKRAKRQTLSTTKG